MVNKAVDNQECTLKEYPNLTFWLEGGKMLGAGNLILTSKRLIFLHRIVMEDWQLARLQELNREGSYEKIIDFALKLDKRNFQMPLSSVYRASSGIYTWLPFPRMCMRIYHFGKKDMLIETTFLFRIPMLKGFVEFEPLLVGGWVGAVKSALKNYPSPA
jgi:hypothetical protein